MKKIFSILLALSVVAANPVFAAQDDDMFNIPQEVTAPEVTTPEVTTPGKFSKVGSYVKNINKTKVALGSTAIILTALAVYNNKTVTKKAGAAIAWMKANPKKSVAIIATLLVGSATAALACKVYDKDKGAKVSAKDALGTAWDATKNTLSKPVNIVTNNKIVTGSIVLAGLAGCITAYDLYRDDSAIKRYAKLIYKALTSKKVVAA